MSSTPGSIEGNPSGQETVETPLSILGLETMTLRVAPDDRIVYANSAFIRYLDLSKEQVIGQSLDLLNRYFTPDTVEALSSAATAQQAPQKIRDHRGHVYELKMTIHGSTRDIVIHDITDRQQFRAYVQRYLPPGAELMTEEDLSTFKFPERRFMSVSFTDLRGFTSLSESLSPEEIREMINAYLEEVIGAVHDNHASVDKIIGDEVMALYGAPRYYRDHALRAIKTACDQISRFRILQREFQRLGRPMPDCGIGINTGDMVVGNIGATTRQDYTVLGSSVNLASRLCSVARGGEILLTEETLWAACQALPEGWEVMESRTEDTGDLHLTGGKADEVLPLPEALDRKVILIGPQLSADPSNAEYYFSYLYLLRAKGIEQPFPVLSVVAAREGEASLSLNDQSVIQLRTEKIFGKYRLIEVIGRGGMGEVWKAGDQFGNPVAIKMLLAGEAATEAQLSRFKQEARILSRLPHRHICRIHEIGEYDGKSYLAMEYIDGLPLDQILAGTESGEGLPATEDLGSLITNIRKKRASEVTGVEGIHIRSTPVSPKSGGAGVLPVQQTISLIMRVCDAIQYAHQHGVLHRDIKPGNIMLRSDGDPVVMDFGLAKLERQDGENSVQSLGVRSMTGMTVGTIDYMAPEQAVSSKDVDERADVYSLGAVLYRMLTGHPHYYVTGHLVNDAQKLQTHDPIPPSVHKPRIDADLEIITLKALRADPAERYRSVAALRDDLDRFQRGEVIHARPVTLREITGKWVKRNRPLFIAVTGSVAAIFVILAVSVVTLNARRLEAERLRVSAEENEKAARVSEAEAVEARRQADTALVQLENEKRENEALLAKYEAERKARGEVEIKLTEAEKQRLQAEAARRPLAQALPRVANALRERPYSLVLHRRVLNELEQGRWVSAHNIVDTLCREHPDSAEGWLLKARVNAAVFHLKDALQDLLKVKGLEEGRSLKFEYIEQQIREFYDVTKDLPGAGQDRELQLAFARRLKESPEQEDHWVGTFLEKQAAGN